MESRLFTPKVLDEEGALNLIAAFGEQTRPFVLDFARTEFAYPLGSLILAAEYRTFVDTRKVSVRTDGIDVSHAAHGYLAHMGFFKSLGIPIGKRPGEAVGSSTCIPITVLSLHELKRTHKSRLSTAMDNPPLASLVEAESMNLAKLVTQDPRPRINRPIAYCFREIVRNVFEHAGVDRCGVYAQRWNNGFIEVAIVDRGKGIRRSLQQRYQLESDRDALSKAIAPGVSAASVTDGGEWANSGFGLFVLSELGKELGSFTLCSGRTSLTFSDGKLACEEYPASFNGTAVGLRIRQLSANQFKALIDQIVNRGEAQVRDVGGAGRASKSTRMSSEESCED